MASPPRHALRVSTPDLSDLDEKELLDVVMHSERGGLRSPPTSPAATQRLHRVASGEEDEQEFAAPDDAEEEEQSSPYLGEAAGGEGGEDTEADAGEDADRLGFFGGDTLLPRSSLDAPPSPGHPPPSPGRGSVPRSPAHVPHAPPPLHRSHDDDGGCHAQAHSGSGEEGGGAEGRALPFEFRVLDAALDAVCSRLEDAVADVEAAAGPALDALAVRVTRRNLEDVKRVRGALARLQARVASVRGELQRLLDDDSDMRDMYLSRKAAARAAALRLWLGVRAGHGQTQTPREQQPTTPHAHAWELAEAGDDADIQELEDLLETYFAQVDHSAGRLDVLKEFIQDTEDYVNIDLDAKRNKILEVNVLVGLAALVHGAASCAYGVFGMNFLLDADGEPRGTLIPDPGGWHAGGFRSVAIAVAALSVLAWVAIVLGFRRDGFIHIIAMPKLSLTADAR